MAEDCKANVGLKTRVEYYKDVFRIPENLNRYCPEDYKIAEKKFLKMCCSAAVFVIKKRLNINGKGLRE